MLAHFFRRPRAVQFIRQSEEAECGLACLAMVSSYFGGRKDMTSLRKEFPISLRGAHVGMLLQIAKGMNLVARPMKVETSALEMLKAPCILHWNNNHFVVFRSMIKDKYYITDPRHGPKTFSKEEFERHFNGVIIELLPSQDFKKEKSNKVLKIKDIIGDQTVLKKSVLPIFFLSVMSQLIFLATPLYVQAIIDDVVATSDKGLLLIILTAVLGLVVLNFAILLTRGWLINSISAYLEYAMMTQTFSKLLSLPLAFFERREVGQVLSRFSSLQPIVGLISHDLVQILLDGILSLSVLAVLWIYSPLLAVTTSVFFVLYIIVKLVLQGKFYTLQGNTLNSKAKEQTNFLETVRGIRVIKAFGKENEKRAHWQELYSDVARDNLKLSRFASMGMNIQHFIFSLENVVLLFIAALLVLDNKITIGMLLAFVFYKQQFVERGRAFVDKLIELKLLSLHTDRIADIALHSSEQTEKISRDTELRGDLAIENMEFSHGVFLPPILKNVKVNIKAGSSVAIVGASGAGKTTLLKIMMGLVLPDRGQIFVDGLPLEDFGLKTYRNRIGVVMQDDALFAGSIASNIAFSGNEIDYEKVERVAKMSAIDNEISKMPMKYATLIGDMGSSLSGGQVQRISIARALYADPKILFMDEATAHLDPITEDKIASTISNAGITTIFCAHRPSTIAFADQVLLVENNTVTEVTNTYKEKGRLAS